MYDLSIIPTIFLGWEEYYPPHISIGMTELIVMSNAKIDKEVDNRLGKIRSAFGRLYKCM